MYKLFVGPERKIFYTHEAVLYHSPVLECMCNGSFKGSMEREIELPDDDATVFGCMLECMYSGIFRGGEGSSRDVKAAMLADLYILAAKYQLEDLKSCSLSSWPPSSMMLVTLSTLSVSSTQPARSTSSFQIQMSYSPNYSNGA